MLHPACTMESIIVKWELTAKCQVLTLLSVWKCRLLDLIVWEQVKVAAQRTLTAVIQRLLVNLVSVRLAQQLVHTQATVMNPRM
jgi:hypothetical protein